MFGTYLCGNSPIPSLAPNGTGGIVPTPSPVPTLPGIPPLPSLPAPVPQNLPEDLRNLVNQFALGTTGPVAPPCEEQSRLGNVVGQNGKYFPHVLPQP